MRRLEPKNKAIIQMLICASLWSIAGIFIKLIPWNPFAIAGVRSFVAACTVGVYMLVTKARFRFTRRSVINGVMMCLTFLAFVGANKLTTSANAIVLQFTNPVFVMIFSSLIWRQKFSRADVTAVVFTMAGISLFFFDQLKPGYLLGNCVGVLSGIFMAAMFLAVGNSDEESRIGGMLLGHLFTAMVGIPFLFFTDSPVTAPSLLYILILGVLQLGIPYLLFALAVKHCPPLVCALLGAVEPLLNPLWVFLFNGETPGPFAISGGIVVICSVTVWCIFRDRAAAEPAEA